jgi:hypothetical protein
MHRRIASVFIIIILCLSVVFVVQDLCAQTAPTLGEMMNYGDVFIRSSSGVWMPAPGVYPIVGDTAIKTEKGSVSLFYKGGSRIDIFESSKVIIDSVSLPYTVHLLEGVLDIKTSPHESFVLKNGSSEILLNDNPGMVQKGGDTDAEGFLGTVSLRDKGLFVTSILGAALITLNDSETKSISSGSSIHVVSDNRGNYTTYETAGKIIEGKGNKPPKPHKPPKPPGQCKKKKHASPFDFCDDTDD